MQDSENMAAPATIPAGDASAGMVKPGPVVLLGSGETSPNIRKVYDRLFARLTPPVRTAILETPAGFEPNSDFVAEQIGDYLRKHLQNHRPAVDIIPARKKATAFSPDDPALLTPLYDADVIMMGPGSPTYAVRQLRDSLAWQTLQACHRLGATVILASAATLASSRQTLPVYEIYKVGEDLHWKEGLNFFGAYGLNLVFVPHWNNNDGGSQLDTSHCYIGTGRYETMAAVLPDLIADEYTVVGIDENTALVVEPALGECWVQGPGGVVIIRDGCEQRFESGSCFPATTLGPFRMPAGADGLPPDLWEACRTAVVAARQARHEAEPLPAAVVALAEEREAARHARDWSRADKLRDAIVAAGWQVRDTPDGPELELAP